MSEGARLRITLAAAFALVSLAGAIVLQAMDQDATPAWALASAAAAYMFGHVQENHGRSDH